MLRTIEMLVNSSQTTFNPAAQTNDLHIHTNHSRAARWAAVISVPDISAAISRRITYHAKDASSAFSQ
jgi:hypothetical protein